MPHALALVLALVLAAPARAQTGFALTPADPGRRTLTVTGQGAAEATADVALVRFAIETRGATVDEAMQKHAAEVERMQRLLRRAGVPDSNVLLDRLSLADDSDDLEVEMGASAFSDDSDAIRVARTVSVRVADLDAVPALMASIAGETDDPLALRRMDVTAGFEVRDVRPLRDRALRLAMQDARSRAAMLAGEAGLRLGRTLSVTEAGVTGALVAGGGSAMGGLASRLAMGMGGGAGSQTETAAVVVVFEVDG